MEIWDLYDKDRNKLNKQHKIGIPLSKGQTVKKLNFLRKIEFLATP